MFIHIVMSRSYIMFTKNKLISHDSTIASHHLELQRSASLQVQQDPHFSVCRKTMPALGNGSMISGVAQHGTG